MSEGPAFVLVRAIHRQAHLNVRRSSKGGGARSANSAANVNLWEWATVNGKRRAVEAEFHRLLKLCGIRVITGRAVDHGGKRCRGPSCEHCARAKRRSPTAEG